MRRFLLPTAVVCVLALTSAANAQVVIYPPSSTQYPSGGTYRNYQLQPQNSYPKYSSSQVPRTWQQEQQYQYGPQQYYRPQQEQQYQYSPQQYYRPQQEQQHYSPQQESHYHYSPEEGWQYHNQEQEQYYTPQQRQYYSPQQDPYYIPPPQKRYYSPQQESYYHSPEHTDHYHNHAVNPYPRNYNSYGTYGLPVPNSGSYNQPRPGIQIRTPFGTFNIRR